MNIIDFSIPIFSIFEPESPGVENWRRFMLEQAEKLRSYGNSSTPIYDHTKKVAWNRYFPAFPVDIM